MERQEHPAESAWSDQPVGRPRVISDHYLRRLEELVNGSPRDHGYPFQRWTAQWLKRHLARETGVEVSDRHINRLLKQMGLSTRSPSHLTGQSAGRPKSLGHSAITIGDLTPAAESRLVSSRS